MSALVELSERYDAAVDRWDELRRAGASEDEIADAQLAIHAAKRAIDAFCAGETPPAADEVRRAG